MAKKGKVMLLCRDDRVDSACCVSFSLSTEQFLKGACAESFLVEVNQASNICCTIREIGNCSYFSLTREDQFSGNRWTGEFVWVFLLVEIVNQCLLCRVSCAFNSVQVPCVWLPSSEQGLWDPFEKSKSAFKH